MEQLAVGITFTCKALQTLGLMLVMSLTFACTSRDLSTVPPIPYLKHINKEYHRLWYVFHPDSYVHDVYCHLKSRINMRDSWSLQESQPPVCSINISF